MPKRIDDQLNAAAAHGDLDEAKALLAKGADPNAVVKGDTALHAAVSARQPRLVDLLVAAGADLNALDENDVTPLMVACNVGGVKGGDMAMQLIRAGADVAYVRKGDDATALTFAVRKAPPEVVEALIARGAPVDGPRGTPITPLMLAAIANNVVAARVLVSNGADLSRACTLPWARGKTAHEMAVQEKKKAVADFLRSCREGASGGPTETARPVVPKARARAKAKASPIRRKRA